MPEGCVADTDVLSYIFRGDSRAAAYESAMHNRIVSIWFMSVAELKRWALLYDWGQTRRSELSAFIAAFDVILVNRALCRTWAAVSVQARRNGRPILPADAWIAATAITLNVPLATHNRNDYLGVDDLILLPAKSG